MFSSREGKSPSGNINLSDEHIAIIR